MSNCFTAMSCHDSETNLDYVIRFFFIFKKKEKKTSCGAKAQQTRPRVAHRGIARFLRIDQKPKLTKNVIRSSHGHSTTSLKIDQISPAVFS